MRICCNVHAASFVKNDPERGEWDDVSELQNPLGLSGEYTFVYDYPLSRVASFKHLLMPEFTGEDILVLARSDYEYIYEKEEQTAGNPGHIPGMLNRQSSDGPYGIWGHDFSDLYFEVINIDATQMRITFGMGS